MRLRSRRGDSKKSGVVPTCKEASDNGVHLLCKLLYMYMGFHFVRLCDSSGLNIADHQLAVLYQ